jgi:hypothetical protein
LTAADGPRPSRTAGTAGTGRPRCENMYMPEATETGQGGQDGQDGLPPDAENMRR